MARESTPIHLRPHAAVAERVLMPGDPGRALRLAQSLLDQPRMLNHHRGLWGYTGAAADGHPLTIQSTGMGGPSAAIVVEELIALGARRLVRVGTCGALAPELALGQLVIADTVLSFDGASRALGSDGGVEPDPTLLAALRQAAPDAAAGTIASTDLFYDERDIDWQDAIAVEMEAAAVLTTAARRGAAAACILLVSDLISTGNRTRIDDDTLHAAEIELGRVAAAALATSSVA